MSRRRPSGPADNGRADGEMSELDRRAAALEEQLRAAELEAERCEQDALDAELTAAEAADCAADGVDIETGGTGSDDAETGDAERDAEAAERKRAKAKRAGNTRLTEVSGLDRGKTLYAESGGSWWALAIGPGMAGAVLILEIIGGGQIHWVVLSIFALVILGFSLLNKVAANEHVSMELTETTLRQGAQTIALKDIAKIYPENLGSEFADWQSARALGELPAVPRRRKGVGIKLRNGKLAQAWARDVETFRTELNQAHLAVRAGRGPKS